MPKVEREFNMLKEKIRSQVNSGEFELILRHVSSLADLQGLLLRYKPTILHCSGHENQTQRDALYFDSPDGYAEVEPGKLAELFSVVNDIKGQSENEKVRCVLLNSCYSDKQAKAISKNVECIIAIPRGLDDDISLAFVSSFYRALGYGKSVKVAFDTGLNQLGLYPLQELSFPRLISESGLDPSQITLSMHSSSQSWLEGTRLGNTAQLQDQLQNLFGLSSKRKRVALLVGVDSYEDLNIPRLAGAENDAREIGDVLLNQGSFSIDKEHFLLGSGATFANVRRALSEIFRKREGEYELVVLYFSGHGFIDGYGNGYLATYDCSPHDPWLAGLSLRELRNVISDYARSQKSDNSTSVIVMMDCSISSENLRFEKGASLESDNGFKANLDDLSSSASNIILISSSAHGETSREELNAMHSTNTTPHAHGLLTLQLLKALEGEAASGDGVTTMGQLIQYLNNEIKRIGKQPSISLEGTNPLSIRLTVSPSRYMQYTSTMLEEIRALINKSPDLYTLKVAADKLSQLKLLGTDSQTLIQLEEEISRILESSMERVSMWLLENAHELVGELNGIKPGLFNELRSLTHNYSIEYLTRISQRELCLLTALYDSINQESTEGLVRVLVRRCRSCIARYEERSEKKSLRTLQPS